MASFMAMAARTWNMHEVLKGIEGRNRRCKIVYLEISAHCSGIGGNISSLPNDKRKLGAVALSADAIRVADLIETLDSSMFADGALINLEMCGSLDAAHTIERKLGGRVKAAGTAEENWDWPGTPDSSRIPTDCCKVK